LLDTFKGKLSLLDENTNGVAHEFGSDLEDILGHGGGKKDDLGGLREELEDIVDLLSETTRQHLIGLIENEHLHLVGLEETTLDHVLDTTRGSNNDLDTILESLHVITDRGTANTGVALDVHEVTDGNNDLLDLLSKLTGGSKDKSLALLDVGVDLLENGDGESSGLSGTRLGLSNNIVTLDDRENSTLLDSRGTLETFAMVSNRYDDLWAINLPVGVNSTKKLGLEVHSIEGVGSLIVVGLDLTCEMREVNIRYIQLRHRATRAIVRR
jgi:hypothetical protein